MELAPTFLPFPDVSLVVQHLLKAVECIKNEQLSTRSFGDILSRFTMSEDGSGMRVVLQTSLEGIPPDAEVGYCVALTIATELSLALFFVERSAYHL